MANFSDLEEKSFNVVLDILQNQDISKLLNYSERDALTKPNVDDTFSLIYNKIFPMPFCPNLIDQQCAFILAFFDGFQTGNNNYFKDGYLRFVIACHYDTWVIDDTASSNGVGIRPIRIMKELDNMFNLKNKYSLGKMVFERARVISLADRIAGYEVSYKICELSKVGY